MAAHPTYTYDQFNGIITNIAVNDLQTKANKLLGELRLLHAEIRKIQDDCIHTYEFSSRGMHNDNYVCKICGHETEK